MNYLFSALSLCNIQFTEAKRKQNSQMIIDDIKLYNLSSVLYCVYKWMLSCLVATKKMSQFERPAKV